MAFVHLIYIISWSLLLLAFKVLSASNKLAALLHGIAASDDQVGVNLLWICQLAEILKVHTQSITLRKTPFFKENQCEFKTLRIGYGMLIECSKIKSNQNRIIEEENDVVGNKFAMGKQQF